MADSAGPATAASQPWAGSPNARSRTCCATPPSGGSKTSRERGTAGSYARPKRLLADGEAARGHLHQGLALQVAPPRAVLAATQVGEQPREPPITPHLHASLADGDRVVAHPSADLHVHLAPLRATHTAPHQHRAAHTLARRDVPLGSGIAGHGAGNGIRHRL